MRHFVHQSLVAAFCAAAIAVTAAAAQDHSTSEPGSVVQSIPPAISQNPQLPQLNLTDAQRAKIKQVLSTKNTEVSFGKTNKSAENFDPAVGAKIPAALKPHPLPPPLIYQMPALKQYTYLKFKGQVLIVNAMSRKIVDMFSET